ncbi:N-6 DNA methylase [Desulfobacterales bacterium HSG2]|nr:N-6 DNA methylase [Desulfobacterales bacterium HSG2]
MREGSLRSTRGVSAQLQAAVREAIEEIANAWVDARRSQKLGFRKLGAREAPLPDGSRDVTAEQLRNEALTYVYRILFCLYAEARGGELGILPINDDHYRLGYSIEALRDLADRAEPGTTSENRTYYAEHLERLFQLIHEGFHPEKNRSDTARAKKESAKAVAGAEQLEVFEPAEHLETFEPSGRRMRLGNGNGKELETGHGGSFVIHSLTATLFDPAATPLLNRVKLGNWPLHKVIRCLSLGYGESGRQLGRINYAELGIVELGAVYEGLLSYKGFFAKEELIQVMKALKKSRGEPVFVYDNNIDPKIPTWFVSKDRLNEFKPGEVVTEHRTKRPRIYRTGKFILHLNGVERAQSASYYTPVALTRTLVREVLKERLKDMGPDQADEILRMKICEPAMGSAAFLVEAVDQLAHHYLRLRLKQKQPGLSALPIDPSDYEDEHRRVRHYIAVRNVYGVDLNPTAVDLGALSLWLSGIHRLRIKKGVDGKPNLYRTGAAPWFGLRLRAGNSLIGARRAVWTKKQLISGEFYGKNALSPRQLRPGEKRKTDEIYHFLVWDEDMGPAARDRLMKARWPEACASVNEWRRKEVCRNWTPEEVAVAREVCKTVDRLWESYAEEREKGLIRTQCTATVWPVPSDSGDALHPSPFLARQEAVKATLESESGAFQRIKLLMDAWCALYFWPLRDAASLPRRDAWLAAAGMLTGAVDDDPETRAVLEFQVGDSFDFKALFKEGQLRKPDAGKLADAVPWFCVGRRVDANQHFHHWELVFTEILGPRFKGQKDGPRGFDLMFGNPPWRKVVWSDALLLAEFEPLLGVRDAKSAECNRQRPKLLEESERLLRYRDAFEQEEGTSVFLNDRTLYPALAGVQTNLYKNFIERSWALLSEKGAAGLLHEEGIFDDPKGGMFRSEYYRRLLRHYQFKNEMKLFKDVDNHKSFSINIYSGVPSDVEFKCIFNLFHPETIEKCYNHQSDDENIPLIKDENGKWDRRGHSSRIIFVTKKELFLFAKLFEDENVSPLEARLPWIHSWPLLKVLEKFAKAPKRLIDLKGEYLPTEMFHESNAQRDGIITRQNNPSFQPESTDDWVISGPHFYVGTPFNKTPRTSCTANKSYDNIDLTEIPEDYLPRAVYRPGDRKEDKTAFHNAIPEWPKPSKPGFWPVSDKDVPAYEALLGEPLKRYGIDPNLPGAKTARKFGYFSEWEGDVDKALEWLLENDFKLNTEEFFQEFGEVKLNQISTDLEQLRMLPKPTLSRFRYVNRRRVQSSNERTLIPSIMPAGISHMNGAFSLIFLSDRQLIQFAGCATSICYDFLIRSSGKSDLRHDVAKTLPVQEDISLLSLIQNRMLRLVALSHSYQSLWQKLFLNEIKEDKWTSNSIRNNPEIELDWVDISKQWCWKSPLRTDRARHQALLEIDVLVALALNLTIDELIQIYKVQFPVMKTYQEADEYDAKGRRLPNTARKDAGVKELREARRKHNGKSPLTVSWETDNGNQTVTKTFYPPFEHTDRIEDYKTAYRVFKERLGL